MIIKSLSRKEKSFDQLVDYIQRHNADSEWDIYHNFFERSRHQVITQFQDNAKHVPKRKNGNYMYHEIVSFTRSDTCDPQHQKEALRHTVEEYIRKRAPNCLAFADLHEEKGHHLHYHIIISANEIGDRKKHRLPKGQFERLKREHEAWVNENYPELEQGKVIQQQASKRLSRAGGELKRRTGRLSHRDQTITHLKAVFAAEDHNEAIALLKKHGIALYPRDKAHGYKRNRPPGVRDTQSGKKYGIERLGLDEEFTAFKDRIEVNALQAGRTLEPAPEPEKTPPHQVLQPLPESKPRQKSPESRAEPEIEPQLRQDLLDEDNISERASKPLQEDLTQQRIREVKEWHQQRDKDSDKERE